MSHLVFVLYAHAVARMITGRRQDNSSWFHISLVGTHFCVFRTGCVTHSGNLYDITSTNPMTASTNALTGYVNPCYAGSAAAIVVYPPFVRDETAVNEFYFDASNDVCTGYCYDAEKVKHELECIELDGTHELSVPSKTCEVVDVAEGCAAVSCDYVPPLPPAVDG